VPPNSTQLGKAHTQRIESKPINVRARLKRLVRRPIYCSKTTTMHRSGAGLFINRSSLDDASDTKFNRSEIPSSELSRALFASVLRVGYGRAHLTAAVPACRHLQRFLSPAVGSAPPHTVCTTRAERFLAVERRPLCSWAGAGPGPALARDMHEAGGGGPCAVDVAACAWGGSDPREHQPRGQAHGAPCRGEGRLCTVCDRLQGARSQCRTRLPAGMMRSIFVRTRR